MERQPVGVGRGVQTHSAMIIQHRTVRQNLDYFAATEKGSEIALSHFRHLVILVVKHDGVTRTVRCTLPELCAKLVKLEDKP